MSFIPSSQIPNIRTLAVKAIAKLGQMFPKMRLPLEYLLQTQKQKQKMPFGKRDQKPLCDPIFWHSTEQRGSSRIIILTDNQNVEREWN